MAEAENSAEFEFSPLSGAFTKNGITVVIEIFHPKGESDGWFLEVVTGEESGVAWDEPFATDREAYDELMLLIEEQGMRELITPPPEGEPATLM